MKKMILITDKVILLCIRLIFFLTNCFAIAFISKIEKLSILCFMQIDSNKPKNGESDNFSSI